MVELKSSQCVAHFLLSYGPESFYLKTQWQHDACAGLMGRDPV